MGSEVEVDCRGMRCPMPVVELARAVTGLEVGQVVALVADDPAAGPDVQAWCRMREQEYVGEDTASDGTPRYLVRRVS
jgi:TusA-related sulfurtransferase